MSLARIKNLYTGQVRDSLPLRHAEWWRDLVQLLTLAQNVNS